jgi:hypothetical protein
LSDLASQVYGNRYLADLLNDLVCDAYRVPEGGAASYLGQYDSGMAFWEERHSRLRCGSGFAALVLDHRPSDPDPGPAYNHHLSYFVSRTVDFLLAMVSENPSGGPFCLFNGNANFTQGRSSHL